MPNEQDTIDILLRIAKATRLLRADYRALAALIEERGDLRLADIPVNNGESLWMPSILTGSKSSEGGVQRFHLPSGTYTKAVKDDVVTFTPDEPNSRNRILIPIDE